MRYIEESDGTKCIDTEEFDLDADKIKVYNADGYGQKDILIQCGYINWKQLDILKEAIAEAERRWRT